MDVYFVATLTEEKYGRETKNSHWRGIEPRSPA